VNELVEKPKNNYIEFINHMQGEQLERLPKSNAKYRIAYFPWELSRIDPCIVETLNKEADGVWCNSQFTADIYKSCGVQEDKLAVVPNGVCLPRLEDKKDGKSYKFLTVGNLGDKRKNTKTLVYAYLNTFTADDNVVLVLKSQPGHNNSDPTALVKFLSAGKENPAKVEVRHSDYTDEQIAELYASCDCYITTSHAEGFCQPILEACAYGMPIIAPQYGGYLEFAHHENFFGVTVATVDASESPVHCLYAEWSDVNYKNLCEIMRQVYNNKLTSEGKNYVPEYTWENSAKIFMEQVDKLIERCSKPKTKIYYENFTRNLWNTANRMGFKRYAPSCIEFVDDYSQANVQVLDITRLSDKYNIKCNKYVALFHCRGEWSEEAIMDYVSIFEGAELVYSHLDLETLMTGEGKWSKAEFNKRINFLRGPWGIDETLFSPSPVHRHYTIMTTGEIPKTEGISECLTACMNVDGKLLHIGPNLGYKSKAYRNTMNLTMEAMRTMYSSSKYVNALRRIEGFEKPAIEGALCGARPICFDTPLYRHWYKDIPVYVREGTFEETTHDLTATVKKEPKEVTEEEKKYIIDKFSWRAVAKNFWNKYLEGTNVS
jgi:glycosyltransferase involved in cell wall biosynthesis